MGNKKLGFSTRAIHSGYEKNEHGALATPIYQTSTFIFDSAEQGGRRFEGKEDGYIYSRIGNPTSTQVEKSWLIWKTLKQLCQLAQAWGL